jgi:large subunit ribosomal protein L30
MSSERYFEVTLKRSMSGRPESQRKVLAGVGIRRFGQVVYLKDTPEIRGMLYKVVHLVAVKPCVGTLPKRGRRSQAAA